jgi:hypothetical protein
MRRFEDLSFSKEECTGQDDQENYRLHHAQVSCVVYGYDEWHWTAYAFVDTEHDDDDGNNTNESENAAVCSQEEIDEDPIACGAHASHLPIWRPRQYFLKAFEARIQEPKREWDELVHLLEVDITECVCSNVLISEYLYKMWSQVWKLMPCRTIHLHVMIPLVVPRKDLTR